MKRNNIFKEFFKEFDEINGIFQRFLHGELRDVEGPLYYGISMQVGPEGEPKITHFGNVRPEITGEILTGQKEPFSDVIINEKEKEAILTLEMPGVEKKDIEVHALDDQVEVKAKTTDRQYYKNMKLDAPIETDTVRATYNNGVLEIKAKLAMPAKKSTKIQVK